MYVQPISSEKALLLSFKYMKIVYVLLQMQFFVYETGYFQIRPHPKRKIEDGFPLQIGALETRYNIEILLWEYDIQIEVRGVLSFPLYKLIPHVSMAMACFACFKDQAIN